jgi:hypothetical protein
MKSAIVLSIVSMICSAAPTADAGEDLKFPGHDDLKLLGLSDINKGHSIHVFQDKWIDVSNGVSGEVRACPPIVFQRPWEMMKAPTMEPQAFILFCYKCKVA